MDTLYYSPGSCALVIHCLLRELAVPFELRRVDVEARENDGAEYRKLNPKGKVPVLVTPEGPLTECVALVEHLCARHDAGHQWLPAPGTWGRARAMERLATLSTEIHNNLFNRFFHADAFVADAAMQAAIKARAGERLVAWFREEDARLAGQYWSGGASPDASDLYFMVLSRWGRWLDPPALRMPRIEPFFRRMVQRPAVAEAFEREGLEPFGAPAS